MNEHVVRMARALRRASSEHEAPIWRRLAEFALKPTVARRTVNVNAISRHTKDGDTVAVPGKVLGTGQMKHPITLFCFSISESAASKVVNAGGRIIDHQTIIQEKPTGRGVVLLG